MIFLTLLLKKNKTTKFDFTRQRTNNTVQFFAATNNTEKKKISNETYLYNNQPTFINHLRNEKICHERKNVCIIQRHAENKK